jgi:mono/diheme cytochrome c family protein
MQNQPRGKPLAVSGFFSDDKLARELYPGTIPHGSTGRASSYYTGLLTGATAQTDAAASESSAPAEPSQSADKEQLAAWRAIGAAEAVHASGRIAESRYVEALPVPLTMELLARGQERFDIYCAVCHDRTGSGDGMVVRKGYTRPPSLHSERLVAARLGHFFNVMTSGFGAMPSYAALLSVPDRWAIAGYIRALQLSQRAELQDVPAQERRALCTSQEHPTGEQP